jgi:hypothetical protein
LVEEREVGCSQESGRHRAAGHRAAEKLEVWAPTFRIRLMRLVRSPVLFLFSAFGFPCSSVLRRVLPIAVGCRLLKTDGGVRGREGVGGGVRGREGEGAGGGGEGRGRGRGWVFVRVCVCDFVCVWVWVWGRSCRNNTPSLTTAVIVCLCRATINQICCQCCRLQSR